MHPAPSLISFQEPGFHQLLEMVGQGGLGDAQGAGYPVDESNKDLSSIPPFGDTEVFLRGDMNGWGETNEMVFASSDDEFNSLLKDMQDTVNGLGYDQVYAVDEANAKDKLAAYDALR